MNEAKKVEMVYKSLQHALETINLVYKPDDKPYGHAIEDIDDEKIQEYYYTINRMCCDLADREVMTWQQEDKDED